MKKYKPVLKETALGFEPNQASLMGTRGLIGEESYACKNFRSDTETCRTGCISSQVQKGTACPYNEDEQAGNCRCYRG